MQSEVKTTTQFGFEVQLSKVYTREVFADFKETLYRIALHSEQNSALRTRQSISYTTTTDWMHLTGHNFQVVADEEKGVYECECKLWTHTGETPSKKKS